MSWPVERPTASAEATRALAGRLATLCRAGDVVLLVGDLGAGKTVFAQGFAAALGVAGPVTSPTFALVRHYRCGPGSPVSGLSTPTCTGPGRWARWPTWPWPSWSRRTPWRSSSGATWPRPRWETSTLEVTLVAPDPLGTPDHRTVTIVGRGRWGDRADEVAAALAPWPGRRCRE